MGAGKACARGIAAAVGGQVEGVHGAALQHARVVHDGVVLTAVGAGGVEKDDGLGPGAGGLVEDFAAAPEWGGEVDVAAGEVVFFFFVVGGRGVRVGRGGTGVGVVQDLEGSAPDMGPSCEGGLVAEDLDTGLFDVHADHAPVALVGGFGGLFEDLGPLLWKG